MPISSLCDIILVGKAMKWKIFKPPDVFHSEDHSELSFLLTVVPNHLTLLSSHCHEGLPVGHFWSIGYPLIWVHLLSANLTMYMTWRNFCFWYSTIMSLTVLNSWSTSLWMCSCNNIPNVDFSIDFYAVAKRWKM